MPRRPRSFYFRGRLRRVLSHDFAHAMIGDARDCHVEFTMNVKSRCGLEIFRGELADISLAVSMPAGFHGLRRAARARAVTSDNKPRDSIFRVKILDMPALCLLSFFYFLFHFSSRCYAVPPVYAASRRQSHARH